MTYLSYINRTNQEQSGMLFNPGLQGVLNRPNQIAAFQGKGYHDKLKNPSFVWLTNPYTFFLMGTRTTIRFLTYYPF